MNPNTERRIEEMIRLAYGPDAPDNTAKTVRTKRPRVNPIKVGKNSVRHKTQWGDE
jgi:hypothetical protein